MDFDLTQGSLEDLFLSKMNCKRVRSLQGLCEEAELPWLWASGLSIFEMVGFDVENPADYLVRFMESYFDKISNEEIILGDIEDESIFSVPTRCRGSSKYASELISKKELLLDWIQENYDKKNIVFATFTLSSKRVSDIKESFDIYRGAVNHIISKITHKNHLGRRPLYLWAIEPHKSGYVHLHMVFFENWIPNFEDIAEWWVDSYTEGRADKQGVDWELVSSGRGGKRVAQDISKYVVKNLAYTDFKEGEDKKQVSRRRRMIWLGMLWFLGRRSWSYSRFLGRVMNGLVKGWTDSTDFVLSGLAGFLIYRHHYVYLGAFSRVEIDRRKEEGTWTFSDLYEGRYGSDGSDGLEVSVSIWDIQEPEVEDLE